MSRDKGARPQGAIHEDPVWESGDLTVTVLGCDGSYPGPGGACSGYLVTCDGTNLWIDCGPGTLAAIQMHLRIEEIDAVLITHEHPDHWSDLQHLGVACRWMVQRDPTAGVRADRAAFPLRPARGGGGIRLASHR